MRFGSTAKVLLKCKLKYYRISECRTVSSVSLSPTGIDSLALCCAGVSGRHNMIAVLLGGHVKVSRLCTEMYSFRLLMLSPVIA